MLSADVFSLEVYEELNGKLIACFLINPDMVDPMGLITRLNLFLGSVLLSFPGNFPISLTLSMIDIRFGPFSCLLLYKYFLCHGWIDPFICWTFILIFMVKFMIPPLQQPCLALNNMNGSVQMIRWRLKVIQPKINTYVLFTQPQLKPYQCQRQFTAQNTKETPAMLQSKAQSGKNRSTSREVRKNLRIWECQPERPTSFLCYTFARWQ